MLAFIVDIALYAYVKQQVGKLDNSSNISTMASSGEHSHSSVLGERRLTDFGAAFWMTFVTLILLLLSGCTVCFGRRRDIGAGSPSYPSLSSSSGGILSRFRKN